VQRFDLDGFIEERMPEAPKCLTTVI